MWATGWLFQQPHHHLHHLHHLLQKATQKTMCKNGPMWWVTLGHGNLRGLVLHATKTPRNNDGSFKDFLIFIPTWGNDPIWRAYVSNGWMPPLPSLVPDHCGQQSVKKPRASLLLWFLWLVWHGLCNSMQRCIWNQNCVSRNGALGWHGWMRIPTTWPLNVYIKNIFIYIYIYLQYIIYIYMYM